MGWPKSGRALFESLFRRHNQCATAGLILGGAILFTVCTSASHAAVIVANSSFESPNVFNLTDRFEYNPTVAEQGGTGWTFDHNPAVPVSQGGVVSNGGFAPFNAIGTDGMYNAPDGSQSGLLQGLADMQQTVSGFTAGAYTVSFYGEGRNWDGGSNTIQVSIDGTLLTFGALGNTVTPPIATSFTHYQSDPFVVAAGAHVLKIIATDFGTGGTGVGTAFIDMVSVTAVPEPAGLVLALVGASLTVLVAVRRRSISSATMR